MARRDHDGIGRPWRGQRRRRRQHRAGTAALAAALAVAAATGDGGCMKEGADATPGTAKTGPAPAATPVPAAASVPAAAASPATASAPSSVPAGGPAATSAADAVVDPQFTLPPSKGPAAYQFQQVTLLRSGPSGDLEMQLTGDGIYRIRDQAHGRSYGGNGKLTDAQIAEWAAALKDWESLKDKYVADPLPATADTIEIIYGGKKVVASTGNKDTPPAFAEAYKRLLALNEQSRKDAAAAEAAAASQPGPGAVAPSTSSPDAGAPAPTAPESTGNPQGVTPKAGPPATEPPK